MAEVEAVKFLLKNLQQVLTSRFNTIRGAANGTEELQKDLRFFKEHLKNLTRNGRKDAQLEDLLRRMRDVVYDGEDAISAYENHTALNLLGIAEVVKSVSLKVKDIKSRIDKMATDNAGDGGSPEELEGSPQVRKTNVVGFEDEVAKLLGCLREETQNLDVISIVGMPGLGKTTLAGMIFHHSEIQKIFSIRLWVYVSPKFIKKDIFLSILKELMKSNFTQDMSHKSDQELSRLVADELKGGNFLIVMDDVWTPEDWDQLKIAFPNKGKVLITSRQWEVGWYANHDRNPHNLRFLSNEESSLLLSIEALGKRVFPHELEVLGKEIAGQCRGLPLAIVVIGGILARKYSASAAGTSAMDNAWEKVSKSVSTYLSEDPTNRMENIISLSYNKLPYHLRPCFLYLGMFPEDYEIPVWKLIRMWIAEGFIQQKEGINLEDTAENYLEDLINRNLVRIDKKTLDGKARTCRIHDMLRDFCKTQAGYERENFLQEIKKSSNGGFEPPISSLQEFRRLCIHSNILEFLSSKPRGQRVRSFVSFPKNEILLPENNTSSIPAAFKVLRVLDVKPIKFCEVSSDLYKLIQLRYIHLSFKSHKLSSNFCNLWNIQTLIIDTTSSTLKIKADIWEMVHLRHLKTNATATLPMPRKCSKGGQKLQTLGTVSSLSCTEEVLDKAPNLKKLGIRGKLALFFDGIFGSFDSLRKLGDLEKLKLLNDGQLRDLPTHDMFPPNLRSLTLGGTYLEWKHMSVLGLLEHLKVLKLNNEAFMGETWKTNDGGFRQLEILHIEHTNLKSWTTSSHNHFPRLRHIRLHNCQELLEIPIELANIPSLQLLEVNSSNLAAGPAKKIHEAKQKKQELEKIAQITSGFFKLSILPAHG